MKQQGLRLNVALPPWMVKYPDSQDLGSCLYFVSRLSGFLVLLLGERVCVYAFLFFPFLIAALHCVHNVCVWLCVCVTAVLLYQAPVWWPGVEAVVEFLSDGISQPPSTQRPAKPQALTFTTNGPPRSTETPEWQSHLSLWRARGEKREIKSDGEYLNGTTLFLFVYDP